MESAAVHVAVDLDDGEAVVAVEAGEFGIVVLGVDGSGGGEGGFDQLVVVGGEDGGELHAGQELVGGAGSESGVAEDAADERAEVAVAHAEAQVVGGEEELAFAD